MQGHEPLSDAGLLFGSIFVAVSIVGIGILGGQQGPEQVASPSLAVAPTTPPTGQTAPKPAGEQKDCLEKVVDKSSNGISGRQEYVCKDNCVYHVSAYFPGAVDVKPVYTLNTKPGKIFLSDISGRISVGTCNEKIGTLSSSLATMSGAFNSSYYQNADAFRLVGPNTSMPTDALAAGTAGSQAQSGLNANYAPGAVTRETLPGTTPAPSVGSSQQVTLNQEPPATAAPITPVDREPLSPPSTGGITPNSAYPNPNTTAGNAVPANSSPSQADSAQYWSKYYGLDNPNNAANWGEFVPSGNSPEASAVSPNGSSVAPGTPVAATQPSAVPGASTAAGSASYAGESLAYQQPEMRQTWVEPVAGSPPGNSPEGGTTAETVSPPQTLLQTGAGNSNGGWTSTPSL